MKLRSEEGSLTSILHHDKKQPFFFVLELEGPGLILEAKEKHKKKRSMREGKSLEKQMVISQTNSTISTGMKIESATQSVKKTDRSKKSTSTSKYKTEHKIIKKNASLSTYKVDDK